MLHMGCTVVHDVCLACLGRSSADTADQCHLVLQFLQGAGRILAVALAASAAGEVLPAKPVIFAATALCIRHGQSTPSM